MRVGTKAVVRKQGLSGLGAPGDSTPITASLSAQCGTNPCTDWDWLWVSDTCANWLACAGQPPVTFASVLGQGTQTIAQGAGEVASSVVSGTASGVATGVASNLSLGGGTLLLGVAAVGVLVLLMAAKR